MERRQPVGRPAAKVQRLSSDFPSKINERETGVEPATLGLGSRCSTTELLPRCDEAGRTTTGSPGAIRFPPGARAPTRGEPAGGRCAGG